MNMHKGSSSLGWMLVVLFCVILMSGAIIFLGLQMKNSNAGGSGGEVAMSQKNWMEELTPFFEGVNLDKDIEVPVFGDTSAKVKITEFSDYQCPFCRSFFEGGYQEIMAKFVDTGLAYMEFRDFPLSFHGDALEAHNAAWCAREQGGDDIYYAFHDALFEEQSKFGVGTVAITNSMLEGISKNLDLNKKDFDKCMKNGSFFEQIAHNISYASSIEAKRVLDTDPTTGEIIIREAVGDEIYGVNATPTVFVNDIKVVGSQPFAVFEQVINAELGNWN